MNKIKIAILTLYHGNDNYGGLAQAWALAHFLESKNFSVEVLDYEKSTGLKGSFRDRAKLYIQSSGKFKWLELAVSIFNIVYSKIFLRKRNIKSLKRYEESLSLRHERFSQFRKSIPHSPLYAPDSICESIDAYDVFISGSDQIWKPGVIQDAFVLKFVQNNKIKISYASSIAISNISSRRWLCQYLQEALEEYDAVSVREESTQKELETILNKPVEWCADPTMLIDKTEWNNMCSKRIIDEKYLFAYILGESQEQRQYIMEYARCNSLKVVTLPFVGGKYIKWDETFGDYRLFDIGVEDFFSLIKYSECVFTDSFHAICFSRVFEKEFYVFDRYKKNNADSMSSRTKSILNLMGLQNRFITIHTDCATIMPINYAIVEKRLSLFIEHSKNFLVEAITQNKTKF